MRSLIHTAILLMLAGHACSEVVDTGRIDAGNTALDFASSEIAEAGVTSGAGADRQLHKSKKAPKKSPKKSPKKPKKKSPPKKKGKKCYCNKCTKTVVTIKSKKGGSKSKKTIKKKCKKVVCKCKKKSSKSSSGSTKRSPSPTPDSSPGGYEASPDIFYSPNPDVNGTAAP